MKPLQRKVLQQLLEGAAEPVLVAKLGGPDWPVAFSNPAFEAIAGKEKVDKRPLADVIEAIVGRELAVEISEAIREGLETTVPVEVSGREYLLALKPIQSDPEAAADCIACYWRGTGNLSGTAAGEAQQALLRAKRRIRDLSREDAVSGLLNEKAFREVLAHDWAVAAREKSRLGVIAFSLEEFDQYISVFGHHASESCVRRVAQAIRRCLRRASDVAARIEREGEQHLVVLSHASEVDGVTEFAGNIAAAVRDLGLHHPRSSVEKFVTVSFELSVAVAGEGEQTADEFLDGVISA